MSLALECGTSNNVRPIKPTERDSWCWTGCSRHYTVDMTSLRVKDGKLWSKEMCLGVTLIRNGLVPWRLGEKMEWRGARETHNPLCNLPQVLLPSGCGCLFPAMRSTKYELNPWKLQTTAAEIFPLLNMFLLGDCSHDQKLMKTMTEWNGSEVPFTAPALHASDIINTVKHASRVSSPSRKIVIFTTRYNAFGKVKHHSASTNWWLKANYFFLLCIIKY